MFANAKNLRRVRRIQTFYISERQLKIQLPHPLPRAEIDNSSTVNKAIISKIQIMCLFNLQQSPQANSLQTWQTLIFPHVIVQSFIRPLRLSESIVACSCPAVAHSSFTSCLVYVLLQLPRTGSTTVRYSYLLNCHAWLFLQMSRIVVSSTVYTQLFLRLPRIVASSTFS